MDISSESCKLSREDCFEEPCYNGKKDLFTCTKKTIHMIFNIAKRGLFKKYS